MGAEVLFIRRAPHGFPLWKSTSLVVAVGFDRGIQDGFQHTLNCKIPANAFIFIQVLGKSL